MTIKSELRELALANDMAYFGVASVDRFANLPDGHRPNDLLPGAKSVISLGIRVPNSAIEANNRAYDGLRQSIFSYVVYGHNRLIDKLEWAALRTVLYLEKKYKSTAYAIPAGIPRDEYLMMAAMSNRYAAVCAGLGEFGWNGLVLTPEDGPRVRWVTVITEAEIEPDPLYGGPKLCDRSKCNKCVESCPVGALSQDEAVKVKINDYESAYALRNKPLCRCATTGLVKGTPGRLQADVPTELKTVEEWSALNRKDNAWQRMEFTHGNYCNRCMVVCPVGRE